MKRPPSWFNSQMVSWANSGSRDLHLNLQQAIRPGTRGAKDMLVSALRDAVRSGQLATGTVLPPSRQLATDLGLARNTVSEAYADLVAEGWLASRQGAGTWVVNTRDVRSPHRPRGTPVQPTHNLMPGSPDVSAFPRNAWLTSARRALTAAPSEALRNGDPRGRPELRSALAEYLGPRKGCPHLARHHRHLRRHPQRGRIARPHVRRPRTDRGGGLRVVPVSRRDRRDGRRDHPHRLRRARRQGRRTRRRRRRGGAADPRPLLPARRSPARRAAHRGDRLGPPHWPLPAGGRLRRRVPLRPPTRRRRTGPRPATSGLPRVGQQEPVARTATRLDGPAGRPRRPGHRRRGRSTVLRQRHRPTDHGGLHRRRSI